jgi:hypothetical protein
MIRPPAFRAIRYSLNTSSFMCFAMASARACRFFCPRPLLTEYDQTIASPFRSCTEASIFHADAVREQTSDHLRARRLLLNRYFRRFQDVGRACPLPDV